VFYAFRYYVQYHHQRDLWTGHDVMPTPGTGVKMDRHPRMSLGNCYTVSYGRARDVLPYTVTRQSGGGG